MGYLLQKKTIIIPQGLPVAVAAAVFCRHSMVNKDNKWYWYG